MRPFQEKLLHRLKQANDTIAQFSAIGELIDDGMNSAMIARNSGLPDYTVRHHARMHKKLVNSVKELFVAGKITFSLARAIAGLPDKEQENATRKAMAKHTSVQDFRNNQKQNNDKRLVKELERLADQLSSLSGLDIHIIADKDGVHAGSWVIRYTDLTMFDTITEKIVGKRSLEEF